MDLISRQAAVDAIRANDDYSSVAVAIGLGKAITAICELPSAQPQRWIPVTEALPEEDGQYLITVKYKHVNDSYEDIYAEHGEWFEGKWDMFCFGHCGEVEGIIAWMPLPEPYAERRHDKNDKRRA